VVILAVMLPCLDVALGQSTDPSEGNLLLACVLYISHYVILCFLLCSVQTIISHAVISDGRKNRLISDVQFRQ